MPGWKIALEIGTFIAVLGAFGATAYYASVTVKMWHEMQLQNRPWIGISKIEVADDITYKDGGFYFKFRYVLKNVGRSPGIALVYGTVVDVYDEEELKCFCDHQRAEIDKSGFESNGSLVLHVVLPELETDFYESPTQYWTIHREMVSLHVAGYIQPYNVGCVFYRFDNEPPKRFHETRFYGEITLADKGNPPPPWKSYGIKLDRPQISMYDLRVVNVFLTQKAD